MQVRRGSTDVVFTYPPRQFLAVPSAVDVRTATSSTPFTPEGDEEACTVDAVDELTSVESAAGTDTLTFEDAPGVVAGRLYMLELATGERTVVEAVSDGETVVVAEPFGRPVPVGSRLRGIRIAHALTTDETSLNGPGKARFRATLDGVVRSWDVEFDVVETMFALTLTTQRLTKAYPQILRLRPDSDELLSEAILAAWEFRVRVDLRARGIREEQIDSPAELEPAIARAVLLRRIEDLYPGQVDVVKQAKDDYEEELEKVLASPTWRMIAGVDDVGEVVQQRQHPQWGEWSHITR